MYRFSANQVVADVLAGAFGSAGERCMSMPAIVPVGQKTAEAVGERLLQELLKLRIAVSDDPQAQTGPVVTAEHRKKIEGYIQVAAEEGAELVIDWRGHSLPIAGHSHAIRLTIAPL
ncbi:MAG: aldehyde dehydrogenase family protein [Candidatus Sulfotelmatobacter sp.]